MSKLAVAFLGESMIELSSNKVGLIQAFAGDSINTAIYLNRLWAGKGNSVSYITGLGDDCYSQEMIDYWNAESINTEQVYIFPNHLPGLYRIETDQQGERRFHYWRSDAAARYLFQHDDIDRLRNQIGEFDYLFLSGISIAIFPTEDRYQLLDLIDSFKARGGKVIFDNNYRKQLWCDVTDAKFWFTKILASCDIALLSYEDEISLYGEHTTEQCIERVVSMGVNELILKRGAKSCLAYFNETITEYLLEPVSIVIDSTAAGDSFNAGYLAARLEGATIASAITSGHALASRVIQYPGAIIDNDLMPA